MKTFKKYQYLGGQRFGDYDGIPLQLIQVGKEEVVVLIPVSDDEEKLLEQHAADPAAPIKVYEEAAITNKAAEQVIIYKENHPLLRIFSTEQLLNMEKYFIKEDYDLIKENLEGMLEEAMESGVKEEGTEGNEGTETGTGSGEQDNGPKKYSDMKRDELLLQVEGRSHLNLKKNAKSEVIIAALEEDDKKNAEAEKANLGNQPDDTL